MANEQTTVPLFVAAEVLTAADMNLSAGTGVPVFSNSTTRDAGFGGAGEKVLAEGQLCYLSDSNIVQYYSGASWNTVGPTTSGLTLISATTIGTTVSTVTVTGCFSSTYDNYKVIINGGVGSINQIGILMTLGSNASGVQGVAVGADYGSAAVSADAANNIAAFEWAGQASTGGIYMSGDIIAPNLAKYTYGSFSGSRFNNNVYVTGAFYEIVNNTQFTAFTLTLNQGTLTGGTIRVYGYANS
jgi:hypothetical protein